MREATPQQLMERALQAGAEFQTWPGHFLFKQTETELLMRQVRIGPSDVGLELGCGNGFQSMLLASRCRRLFATDLLASNPHTHSVGLGKAQALLARCHIENVTLLSCAAEALPFPDAQFDFVFSSSVLEHVSQRRETLREMYRVLKPSGQMIIAVPTHVASFCAFPHLALYIGIRAVQVLVRKLAQRNMFQGERVLGVREAVERDHARSFGAAGAAFWQNHRSFPLPEPHGAYDSILQELKAQFPSRWKALIESEGFTVERPFALTLVPISLLEVISSSLMARTYQRTAQLHARIATHPGARALTYIWAAVCRKRAQAAHMTASAPEVMDGAAPQARPAREVVVGHQEEAT